MLIGAAGFKVLVDPWEQHLGLGDGGESALGVRILDDLPRLLFGQVQDDSLDVVEDCGNAAALRRH